MLRLPSAQRTYDDYYSGDPAFAQMPAGATSEQATEWRRGWDTARKIGDFRPLLVAPDAQPTKFGMRLIPSESARKLGDLLRHNATKPGSNASLAIISEEWRALVFRCAIVDIAGFGDAKVRLVARPVHVAGFGEVDLGAIAASDIVTDLDLIDSAIVAELGMEAWIRTTQRDPS